MSGVENGIVAQACEIWSRSPDYELVFHFLSSNGVSKFDSIKVVRQICGVSLGEAKRIVMLSAEWRDTLEATAELHDALFSAVQDEGRS